eukprot:4825796-Amphidinium_carterae.5
MLRFSLQVTGVPCCISVGEGACPLLGHEVARAKRALLRGMAPPTQRASLPVQCYDRLWGVECSLDVVGMKAVAVVGSWWFLREIECPALEVREVHLCFDQKVASLTLAVSKTDPSARGCVRSHGCSCGKLAL